jgi:hypothetical protein
MPGPQEDISDEEVIAAFIAKGFSPEECWICCNTPIYPLPDGSGGRPIFSGARTDLEDACLQYLRRIGRPDVQLKGE